jgi:hypothetical protein
MPFTDRDVVHWLVYIEGVPPDPRPRRWDRAVLPGRRLRFDSATESRITLQVPAGSPYLAERQLQLLLDQAQPLLAKSQTAATQARPPVPGESGARRDQPPLAVASKTLRRLGKWASDRTPALLSQFRQVVSAVLATIEGLEDAMRSVLRGARR